MQRLRQPEWCSGIGGNKAGSRVHRFENYGTGGRVCIQQGEDGAVYHTVCPVLYAVRCNCCCDSGRAATAGSGRRCRSMEGLDLSCSDIPDHFLPMCTCYLCSVELLWRNRQCFQKRHFGKGQQLSGSAVSCTNRSYG